MASLLELCYQLGRWDGARQPPKTQRVTLVLLIRDLDVQRSVSPLSRGIGRAAQPRAVKNEPSGLLHSLSRGEDTAFWFGRLIVSTALEGEASDTR